MKTKRGSALALLALIASAAGYARLSANASVRLSPLAGYELARRPAAGQLPRGFTLPPADVDLAVSSLVTTDLDADGDLDIVAADRSNGAIGIVVWVNDGAGRLTRKAPARSTNLAGEPLLPTLDGREATVVASMQPRGPAVETIAPNPWLASPVQPHGSVPSVAPDSALSSALRSRSPPANS